MVGCFMGMGRSSRGGTWGRWFCRSRIRVGCIGGWVRGARGRGVDVSGTTGDLAWKQAPMISPAMFRELVMPRLRRVAEKVTKPWIVHSDGNIGPPLQDFF